MVRLQQQECGRRLRPRCGRKTKGVLWAVCIAFANDGWWCRVVCAARGFFVTFDGQPVPEIVKKWDVTLLSISPSKRHLDMTASRQFWAALDAFTRTLRPDLRT